MSKNKDKGQGQPRQPQPPQGQNGASAPTPPAAAPEAPTAPTTQGQDSQKPEEAFSAKPAPSAEAKGKANPHAARLKAAQKALDDAHARVEACRKIGKGKKGTEARRAHMALEGALSKVSGPAKRVMEIQAEHDAHEVAGK